MPARSVQQLCRAEFLVGPQVGEATDLAQSN